MRTISVADELLANGMLPSLFNDLFGAPVRTPSKGRAAPGKAFPLDVEEREGGYAVIADLPGISKEAIEITVEDERLTIAVTPPKSGDAEKRQFLHRERRATEMTRSVLLKDAAADSVEAELKDGVLTVLIKKDERHLPKRIQIR